MSGTCIAPEPETTVEDEPVRLEEPEAEPEPVGWKQRIRYRLVAIFEGHEEFLGWTPD